MKQKWYRLETGKTNAYLLSCEGGYLLIDTGYANDYPNFLKELNRIKISINEIKYLLLTHHHDDHSGFVNKLLKDSNVKLIVHRESIDLLKTGENDKTRGGGYINKRIYYLTKLYKLFQPDWTLTFPPVDIRDTDIIIEGDDDKILLEIGIQGKILYTPGHSIDSISVLLDDGTLFCGDAAMSWLLWAGTNYCTLFITDMVEFYDSWKKMIQEGVKVVYPSHGKSFRVSKLVENIDKYRQEMLVRFF